MNSRYEGRKRHEAMILRDARVNFGDEFFDDVEDCSAEPANLDDVCLLPLSSHYHFLFFFFVSSDFLFS